MLSIWHMPQQIRTISVWSWLMTLMLTASLLPRKLSKSSISSMCGHSQRECLPYSTWLGTSMIGGMELNCEANTAIQAFRSDIANINFYFIAVSGIDSLVIRLEYC